MNDRMSYAEARQFISIQPDENCTAWIDPTKRPIHVGWYQVQKEGRSNEARYWSGTIWMLCSGCNDAKDASRYQNWTWRGILDQRVAFAVLEKNIIKARMAQALTIDLFADLNVRELKEIPPLRTFRQRVIKG